MATAMNSFALSYGFNHLHQSYLIRCYRVDSHTTPSQFCSTSQKLLSTAQKRHLQLKKNPQFGQILSALCNNDADKYEEEDVSRVTLIWRAIKLPIYSVAFIPLTARGSLLMFIVSLLTIMAIGGFSSFLEDMKVFQREKLNGHYKLGAFVISNTISSIPFLLVISSLPGAITYYLVGLQQHTSHFIYFALTLFACMLLVESLMIIVASIVPNFLMGLTIGGGIQGLMMLSGGFFRLPNDLPRVFFGNILCITLHFTSMQFKDFIKMSLKG